MGYKRHPTTLRIKEDNVKRENDTTLRRVEEIAKTHDVISRAKAASPVAGGKDRLDRLDPGFQRLNGL
jgi:hypothetical protein